MPENPTPPDNSDNPPVDPGDSPESAAPVASGVAVAERPAEPADRGVAQLYPGQLPAPVRPPRSVRIPFPHGGPAAIVVSGVAAAVLIPRDRPGIGWLLAGVVVAIAVYTVDRAARRATAAPDDAAAAVGENAAAAPESETAVVPAGPGDRVVWWERVWWTGLALALLSVGAFRAAAWLFALCVLGAAVAGSLAVVGRRSVYGMAFDVLAVPFTAAISVPWVYRGLERAQRRRGASGSHRVWWSVAVTVALLLVVVPLLAGADAVFARMVAAVVPEMEVAALWRWVWVFATAGLGTAGALYLLAGPPRVAVDAESGVTRLISRRFTRLEWGLPVGALTLVFAVFVATQLAVLFGGDEYVQRTAELTYAEYARTGFWQLSIVSMLTLGVIWLVWQGAAKRTGAERLWLRIALGLVSALSLVIVASAVSRMWIYQQAYGFTVLRLMVEAFELWIGFVYLLVAASLMRLDRRWPARAALGVGLATLLALAVLNPEKIVAERNIDRWEAGKALDTRYLSRLSADALPAVDRLPERERAQIAGPIRAGLEPDPWQGWNLSRASGR